MTKKKVATFTKKQLEHKVFQATSDLETEIAELKVAIDKRDDQIAELVAQRNNSTRRHSALRAMLDAPTVLHAKFAFGSRVFVTHAGGSYKAGILVAAAFSGNPESEPTLGVCFAAGEAPEVFVASEVHERDNNPAFAVPGEAELISTFRRSSPEAATASASGGAGVAQRVLREFDVEHSGD